LNVTVPIACTDGGTPNNVTATLQKRNDNQCD
jgi:hypothetical protein